MPTDDIHTRSFCPKCDKEVQLSPDTRVRELVEAANKSILKCEWVCKFYCDKYDGKNYHDTEWPTIAYEMVSEVRQVLASLSPALAAFKGEK